MEIWLVVGREMSKNQLKHVYLLSNKGQRKVMTVNQLSTFSNKNKVVNVKAYGGQLQGVGISLLSIPTYKKDAMGQMIQVSGASEQYVINAAQPYINKLLQDEQRKEAKKNMPDADKENKINYIINKLQLCFNILNELENTKSLTNEKLLLERVSRYTKQLDVDNADDSIENMVQRYGITGLVKSVDTRIDRCKERARKYNLLKEDIHQKTGYDTIQSLCEMMYQKVENIKKQHKITYDIIKEGKVQQAEEEKKSQEEENNMLNIEKYLNPLEEDNKQLEQEDGNIVEVDALEEEADMSQAEIEEIERLKRTVCNVIAYKFKERTTLLEPGRYSYYQLIPLNILTLIGTQLMHDPEYSRDYMNNVYCSYGSILGDNGRFGSDNFGLGNYVFIGTKRYANITNGMRTDEMGRKVAEQVLLDVFLYGEHKKLVNKQFNKIARSAVSIYDHNDRMNGLEICDEYQMGNACKEGIKEEHKKLLDMIVDTCMSIQNKVVKEVKK